MLVSRVLLSGLVIPTVLPASRLWVLRTLLGIDFLSRGKKWLASAGRPAAKAAQEAPP
jgi:uncharacterized membrane protein HdeD (DUF308 family)